MSRYNPKSPKPRNGVRPEMLRRAQGRANKYYVDRAMKNEKRSNEPLPTYLNISGITPEFYSDVTGTVNIGKTGKIAAVGVATAIILAGLYGFNVLDGKSDNNKNPNHNSNDNGTFRYPSSGSVHVNWDASNGDDMRPLETVNRDTKEGKVVLTFLHKEGNKGEAIAHKAIMNNDKGEYRQSEEWADSSKDPVKWKDVAYAGAPWLFEHPTMDGDPKEWLNAIEGELSMVNGTPVIRNVTKIALYDGQVSELGDQSTIQGVVRSIEDKPSGAKLVHLIVPRDGTNYEKLLYFSGNRLYKANNQQTQTVDQLGISTGDMITVDVRTIEKWGQLMPESERVDGAFAVFEYRPTR